MNLLFGILSAYKLIEGNKIQQYCLNNRIYLYDNYIQS